MWDPTASKVVISKDVIFAENELQGKQGNGSIVKKTTKIEICDKSREDNSSKAKQEHKECGADKASNRIVRQSTR